MSLLLAFAILSFLALGVAYYVWRASERPSDGFFSWLYELARGIPQSVADYMNPSHGSAIKTRDLPEAPPRVSGDHEELELRHATREEEIAELKRLFDES